MLQGFILTRGVLLRGALGGVPEAGTLSRDMLVATGVSTLQAEAQQYMYAVWGCLRSLAVQCSSKRPGTRLLAHGRAAVNEGSTVL